ncbi:9534_t:CDS:1 [Ambispora leptoticha]|uniref:9534_t:CDS:1 n=1 Tax=Ambispora leptoticha TaxID=144679 RepID=A0A9N9DDU1_9GLOM|nr:9534_t:CDS:1 [Ambispora leptoticha]
MTWHTYFDENKDQDWSICKFYKNWIRIYEEDYENLIHGKAVDALAKSLREIINKSPEPTKVQKAKKLLKASICLYMEIVLGNNLLDNCGCPQQGSSTFSRSSEIF